MRQYGMNVDRVLRGRKISADIPFDSKYFLDNRIFGGTTLQSQHNNAFRNDSKRYTFQELGQDIDQHTLSLWGKFPFLARQYGQMERDIL